MHSDALPMWPTHQDGRPKKFGELTKEEQREQLKASLRRIQTEFQHPAMQAVLNDD